MNPQPSRSQTGDVASQAGRREQQVARILEAARCCFARSGFQGASMQEICARAEMSPGALYRYFPSKEAIVAAIAEANRKENLFANAGDGPLVDDLVASLVAFLDRLESDGNCALMAELIAESMRNPGVAELRDRKHEQVNEVLQPLVTAAAGRGEIDPVIPLDQVPSAVMALLEGFIVSRPLRHALGRDGVEKALRAALQGLLRPTPEEQGGFQVR